MADTSLDLIGAKDRLLIEGRFAACRAVHPRASSASARTAVYTASAEADVSFGALRLVWPDCAPRERLTRSSRWTRT